MRTLPLLLFLILPAAAENYYDSRGAYQGRTETDASGNTRFYDRNGAYQGRMQNGRFYDRSGSYQGRQENGRFYDKNGSFRGSKR